MSLSREVGRAVRSTIVLWLLLALLYPLAMVAFAQVAFPFQANGSLLKNSQGKVVGSQLIGQPFSSDRYFYSRPSAVNYSTDNKSLDTARILATGVSGGSNLAPSNPALLELVQKQITFLKKNGVKPTFDLVYASGSGLDPHITPEGANAQVARIAKSRALSENQIKNLIKQNTEGRFLGIFGENGVNVLKLNLALDNLKT